tara:strand:- start:1481 stop:1831 length:351 start_codon:yes stop_codon:yes gene_type:complete
MFDDYLSNKIIDYLKNIRDKWILVESYCNHEEFDSIIHELSDNNMKKEIIEIFSGVKKRYSYYYALSGEERIRKFVKFSRRKMFKQLLDNKRLEISFFRYLSFRTSAELKYILIKI